MGFLPAAGCRSNFHGALFLARSEYIGVIGEPAIISYDVRFDYALDPTLYASGYYAIHIPHLNPGFPAHKVDMYIECITNEEQVRPLGSRELCEEVLATGKVV
ncbi:hypothetical protein VTP01DRAFT_5494 [Rhizomucor pusillus]|uniref:uncharacterized protein n=1 Tax=Rhizomucor pusillus TaxID=4840 RepID=UPI0037442143